MTIYNDVSVITISYECAITIIITFMYMIPQSRTNI